MESDTVAVTLNKETCCMLLCTIAAVAKQIFSIGSLTESDDRVMSKSIFITTH